MICFFWDFISLRKRSTKSSGLVCEESIVTGVLTASLVAEVEFCAKMQLAGANTPNIKAITRRLFWFMGFLTYGETRVRRGCRAEFQTRTLQQARFQSSS